MATSTAVPVSRPGAVLGRAGGGLARGIAVGYLSLIVLVPLAALVWSSRSQGLDTFWQEVTKPQASSALKLTLGVSLLVAAFNAVIDLPFALPTVVAGLVLLELYGPSSPFGVDVAFQRAGIVLALLFVTLPFVVRAVQPVLLELDREMEEAAESLGAGRLAVFRRIVFPNLLPAILSGVALAFARAVGEFGSVVLISGNIPFKTEVSSVYIAGQIESGNSVGAAAVSVLLLLISLGVLLAIGAFRHWRTRHDR